MRPILIMRNAGSGGGPVGVTPIIWNSADKSSDITLSEVDKRATRSASGSAWRMARSASSITIGGGSDLMVEVEILGDTQVVVGFAGSGESLTSFVGGGLGGYGYYANSGNKMNAGTAFGYGVACAVGDKIRAKITSTGTVEFFKNGVSQGVAFTGLSGTFYPAVSGFTASTSSGRAT